MPLNCPRQTILLRLELFAEKMEWENGEHVGTNLRIHPEGFDLILGAGIYIQKYLFFFFFDIALCVVFLPLQSIILLLHSVQAFNNMAIALCLTQWKSFSSSKG